MADINKLMKLNNVTEEKMKPVDRLSVVEDLAEQAYISSMYVEVMMELNE